MGEIDIADDVSDVSGSTTSATEDSSPVPQDVEWILDLLEGANFTPGNREKTAKEMYQQGRIKNEDGLRHLKKRFSTKPESDLLDYFKREWNVLGVFFFICNFICK
jgi:hypothetical protein